jgi:hypothetical protein
MIFTLRPILVPVLVGALVSCTGVIQEPGSSRPSDFQANGGLLAPSRATFQPAADVLQASCGTLDCHGQVGRNLRLYGGRGLRLSPQDNSADDPTTLREYDQSYWSVIGLEPELMSDVVRDQGRAPERLTMVRKARGTEKHKGGQLFVIGDIRDRCLVSWLAGAVDEAACKLGAEVTRPSTTP